jgi:hypothetical protein
LAYLESVVLSLYLEGFTELWGRAMVWKKGLDDIDSAAAMHVRGLEQLLIRLRPDHPARDELKRRLYSIRAGIAGEKRVVRYLEMLNLQYPFRILWDINLQIAPGYFVQIDVLILTPTHLIIYEAKNIAGRLRFESHPARLNKVNENGEIVDTYDCPIHQLQDEILNLERWLQLHNIPCAVDGAVVMTGNAIIEKPPTQGRLLQIREIRHHMSRRIEGGKLKNELDELATYIVRHNRPFNPFPLITRHRIRIDEVCWYPICEKCHQLVRRKTKRQWICGSCGRISPDPFTGTLEDWFLLRSASISNSQVRKLFGLGSAAAATRVLNKYRLKRMGNSRATVYTWHYRERLKREI